MFISSVRGAKIFSVACFGLLQPPPPPPGAVTACCCCGGLLERVTNSFAVTDCGPAELTDGGLSFLTALLKIDAVTDTGRDEIGGFRLFALVTVSGFGGRGFSLPTATTTTAGLPPSGTGSGVSLLQRFLISPSTLTTLVVFFCGDSGVGTTAGSAAADAADSDVELC